MHELGHCFCMKLKFSVFVEGCNGIPPPKIPAAPIS